VPGCTRIPSDDAGTLCARGAICVTRGYMKACVIGSRSQWWPAIAEIA
jgi:hypothetical protein